jgi:hypothetical protein
MFRFTHMKGPKMFLAATVNQSGQEHLKVFDNRHDVIMYLVLILGRLWYLNICLLRNFCWLIVTVKPKFAAYSWGNPSKEQQCSFHCHQQCDVSSLVSDIS